MLSLLHPGHFASPRGSHRVALGPQGNVPSIDDNVRRTDTFTLTCNSRAFYPHPGRLSLARVRWMRVRLSGAFPGAPSRRGCSFSATMPQGSVRRRGSYPKASPWRRAKYDCACVGSLRHDAHFQLALENLGNRGGLHLTKSSFILLTGRRRVPPGLRSGALPVVRWRHGLRKQKAASRELRTTRAVLNFRPTGAASAAACRRWLSTLQ